MIVPEWETEPSPPISLRAEKAFLGVVLTVGWVNPPPALLRPLDFALREHSTAYSAMLRMYAEKEPVDPLTLAFWLGREDTLSGAGGLSYLSSLLDGVPCCDSRDAYAQIVMEAAGLRKRRAWGT